ncbi:MAG: outer membrane beta-barrel protein [Steroidobacteraceae bacterium]
MKHAYRMMAAVALIAAPLTGLTQDWLDNPTGPYVGVGVGQFNVGLKRLQDVNVAVTNIRNSDDTAMKIFAGWRLLPFLSVEGGYVDLGKPGDDFETSGSHGSYRLAVSGFTVAALGRVPLGPVELFGKVGQYFYDVRTRIDFDGGLPSIRGKDSRNDFMWGGGLSFVMLQHLEVRAEYEKLELRNTDRSDAFWLSAAWRF